MEAVAAGRHPSSSAEDEVASGTEATGSRKLGAGDR